MAARIGVVAFDGGIVQHPEVLRINGKTLGRLLQGRFGRVAIPPEAWEGTKHGKIDRTTLYRWRKGEVEPKTDHLFEVAALLGVDPCLLLLPSSLTDFSDGFKLINEAPSLAELGDESSALISLLKAFRGLPIWPCDKFSASWYRRAWTRNILHHDNGIKVNYYGNFLIEFTEGIEDKVVHFAWKGPRGRSWCPYGFVVVTAEELRLYSYDGSTCGCPISDQDNSFAVETWFGPGSASFCLASLHPFEVTLKGQVAESVPTVRFGVDD